MIKVLWITSGGSWIDPLMNEIKKRCQLEVILPCVGAKEYRKEQGDQIAYHHLPVTSINERMEENLYKMYKPVVEGFAPDIIHVHGTEINYAQIQNYVKDIPVVTSIQGFLHGCLKYNTAFVKPTEIARFMSLKNLTGRGGLYQADRMCRNGVKKYEMDILKHGKYFFGRTLWDKAHLAMINPDAHYFEGEELLREPFYKFQGQWDINRCDRNTIFMPSGFNPLKGLHIAVSAVALLKREFPDIKLKVPGMPLEMLRRKGIKKILIGEDFLEYIKSIIKAHHLENNIVFLPRLNAEEMAEELLKSHVFLSPSTIDNSSNAIGEATMLGLPIVTTAVGGVMYFMKDEENCLLAPSGDEYVIAYQIRRLLNNEVLSSSLGANAYLLAQQRHDASRSAKAYIDAYSQIVKVHKGS